MPTILSKVDDKFQLIPRKSVRMLQMTRLAHCDLRVFLSTLIEINLRDFCKKFAPYTALRLNATAAHDHDKQHHTVHPAILHHTILRSQ